MSRTPQDGLLEWLGAIGYPATDLEVLAGDVSQRRYFRVRHRNGGTSILATYPESMKETCRRFARTGSLLESAGVRVPRIRINDCSRGFMLLEDAGSETLYDREARGWAELSVWIRRAATVLEHVGRVPAASVAELNPPLDGEALRRELAQTWDVLLDPRGLGGSGEERSWLRSALDEVCARLDSAPRVVCHRDFMARNLVPTPGGDLVLLDHQDMRPGPAFYDLASLLNDSLFAPAALESRLLGRLATESGALDTYHRCVVQRTLKAAGTFAAFAQRGSDRHLGLVPPALERAARSLGLLPEGRELPPAIVSRWSSIRPAG